MMESTEPERYYSDLAPYLPALTADRVALQERIIATQVRWADAFHVRYPRLGEGMRLLRTAQDTVTDTSFETYLRGELSSYSDQTVALYGEMIDAMAARRENLTEAHRDADGATFGLRRAEGRGSRSGIRMTRGCSRRVAKPCLYSVPSAVRERPRGLLPCRQGM
ncbi:hypothetical protein GCM10025876_23260 [Demequina litorisediminis]|uniref:Uncharacterized protein n=1 Tax=Demequina litorisediminis TaxID=1849022 RepID=A0ABQ6IG33_9MICO|nr:hypothetical protein GCM10025876_23260 [Demequina litorisediminis]